MLIEKYLDQINEGPWGNTGPIEGLLTNLLLGLFFDQERFFSMLAFDCQLIK